MTNGLIKDLDSFNTKYRYGDDGRYTSYYELDDLKPSPVKSGDIIIHDLKHDKYFKDEDEYAEWLRDQAEYETVQIPYDNSIFEDIFKGE